jgi:hypothetical protein
MIATWSISTFAHGATNNFFLYYFLATFPLSIVKNKEKNSESTEEKMDEEKKEGAAPPAEEEGMLFRDLLQEEGGEEEAGGRPKRPARAWPPLPAGYTLPSDPRDLRCSNYLELWGQCAGDSLLSRD